MWIHGLHSCISLCLSWEGRVKTDKLDSTLTCNIVIQSVCGLFYGDQKFIDLDDLCHLSKFHLFVWGAQMPWLCNEVVCVFLMDSGIHLLKWLNWLMKILTKKRMVQQVFAKMRWCSRAGTLKINHRKRDVVGLMLLRIFLHKLTHACSSLIGFVANFFCLDWCCRDAW